MAIDQDRLIFLLNAGLQALIRDEVRFPVEEELPLLPFVDRFTFAKDALQPPTALLLSHKDQILVQAWNATANNALFITGRILRPDGDVAQLNELMSLSSDRAQNVLIFPPIEGCLLSLSVLGFSASAHQAGCYVKVDIVRGGLADAVPVGLLMAGYVGNQYGLNWPQTRYVMPEESRGWTRRVQGTNPAAGNEIAETVPTGATWRIVSVRTIFTASAAAANRVPFLEFADGPNIMGRYPLNVTITAGQAFNIVWSAAPNLLGNVSNWLYGSIPPDFVLSAGMEINTVTSGIQAADDYTAPILHLEEWINPL